MNTKLVSIACERASKIVTIYSRVIHSRELCLSHLRWRLLLSKANHYIPGRNLEVLLSQVTDDQERLTLTNDFSRDKGHRPNVNTPYHFWSGRY